MLSVLGFFRFLVLMAIATMKKLKSHTNHQIFFPVMADWIWFFAKCTFETQAI
jgi:hypothetical protein